MSHQQNKILKEKLTQQVKEKVMAPKEKNMQEKQKWKEWEAPASLEWALILALLGTTTGFQHRHNWCQKD